MFLFEGLPKVASDLESFQDDTFEVADRYLNSDGSFDEDRVHVGPGGGKGKSMTRILPRGNLKEEGQEGMKEGVDSVVEIAGMVDIDRGERQSGCGVAVEGGGDCVLGGGHRHEN